ncbi:hypothetical protein DBR09_14580 [Aeromonas sp. HMWF016]|nr:hypothetical protein DBR09_14580 [Aeromonas sp. HMWF016]
MRALAKYKFIHKLKIEDVSHEKKVISDFQDGLYQYGISKPNASKLSSMLIRYSKSIQHSYFALWYSNSSILLMESDDIPCISEIRASIKKNDNILFKMLGEAKAKSLIPIHEWDEIIIPCHIFIDIQMMDELVETLKKTIDSDRDSRHIKKHLLN